MKNTVLYIGCSGFYYKDWKGAFYPDDLPQREWLIYYAERFGTVEINASFYHLPRRETLERWHNETPRNFRITLKGSRFVTHVKKLTDVEEPVDTFYELAALLKGKLGCVLWQLPGNLHRDDERLERFCDVLRDDFRNVIEFRHRSWFEEPVYDILSRRNVSLCIVSAPGDLPAVVRTTTDTAYVRFHGKERWYRYRYSSDELKEWGERIESLKARRIYIYFNNDYDLNAVDNARELEKLLRG